MSTKQLDAALRAARVLLPGIAKDKYNTVLRVKYVSVEAMVAACRDVLADVGLLLVPGPTAIEAAGELAGRELDKRTGETYETRAPQLVRSQVWHLVHAESGEQRDLSTAWPLSVHRGKPADMACASSASMALSYLLRDLLLLPRGEEYEAEAPAPTPVTDDPTPTPAPTPAPTPVTDDPVVTGARGLLSGELGDGVRVAMGMGLTPGETPPGLEIELPPSPTVGALPAWLPPPVAATLAACGDREPVKPAVLNDVHTALVARVGKAGARAAWAAVGVTLAKGVSVTGYQAKWAAVCAAAGKVDR